MNDVQHNNALAFSARVLGALFYFAPNSTLAEPLVTAFTDGEWVTQWPYEVPHANTPVSYTHLTLPTICSV